MRMWVSVCMSVRVSVQACVRVCLCVYTVVHVCGGTITEEMEHKVVFVVFVTDVLAA